MRIHDLGSTESGFKKYRQEECIVARRVFSAIFSVADVVVEVFDYGLRDGYLVREAIRQLEDLFHALWQL